MASERKREIIVVVATVRLFGEVAEIPLAATRFKYCGQEICRSLMDELERQLVEIDIACSPCCDKDMDYKVWVFKVDRTQVTQVLKL